MSVKFDPAPKQATALRNGQYSLTATVLLSVRLAIFIKLIVIVLQGCQAVGAAGAAGAVGAAGGDADG